MLRMKLILVLAAAVTMLGLESTSNAQLFRRWRANRCCTTTCCTTQTTCTPAVATCGTPCATPCATTIACSPCATGCGEIATVGCETVMTEEATAEVTVVMEGEPCSPCATACAPCATSCCETNDCGSSTSCCCTQRPGIRARLASLNLRRSNNCNCCPCN